jgi:adenylate kinase
MATYVVLMGPPGGGKGTQAQRITDELGIPQVSTGDLFRAMKTLDTPLARQVQDIMASGDLVPDDVTVQMVKERLSEQDCAGGAILDGFPRTTAQADALAEMLADSFNTGVTVAVLIDISEAEAVKRISGRRSCPACKRVYHVDYDPPRQAGVCDDDGTPLDQRKDDQPDVVRDRYQVYMNKTAPLISYYEERELLERVNGKQPMESVTADLLQVIRKRIE